MIFVDKILLEGESPEKKNDRLEEWKEAHEDKLLKISRNETKYKILISG